MVQIRALAIAAMCLILAIGATTPQPGAATPVLAATAPQLIKSLTLPSSDSPSTATGKYPRAASRGNQVYIAANPNQNVEVWSKTDSATSVGDPANLGSVTGSTNYANASIATAVDGTAYVVWITYKANISIRRKPAGSSTWEAAQKVYTTSNFLTGVDVTVASDGKIFVAWNEDFLYRYRTSTNGGASWSGTQTLTSKTPRSVVKLASGPNGEVLAAFAGNDGNAYAAPWNGSSFDTINVTPFKTSNDYFADATAAIAPNGKYYIAFRNGSDAGGIFYSERQTDKTWPVSKLASGAVYGSVSISADANNNLHMFWAGQVSGGFDMWYAFKPVSGDWQGPIQATGAKTFANVNGTGTVGDKAYGHGLAEIFSGDRSADQYYLFSAEGGSSVSATPSLDGGATATRNSVVTVSFSNVTGSPDGVRTHWDAAPTDSDPWVTFANPLTVQGPTSVSADACETHVLYVQVRKGTTAGSVGNDSEIFDTGIQAAVNVLNPHMTGLSAYSGLKVNDVYTASGSGGASDGAAGYTREGTFYLGINGINDCSNLSTYHIPGSDSDPTPHTIANNIYSGPAAVPAGSTPGDRAISVDVTDKLGNSKTWQYTLTYDPPNTDTSGVITNANTLGRPVLADGGKVTANSANSIIRSFSFQDISVTDNLYGKRESLPDGKQFWGVWMANARTDVGADSATLNWYPVRVDTPGSSFSVTWDLFSGLGYTSDLLNKTGEYFVYVRFLDGAGNPSTKSISTTATLTTGYTIPTVELPVLRR